MIGIVLAGGRGRRLEPLTETRPKVLLPIVDKPVVYRPLKLLSMLGIKDIVVVVSYMGEKVVEYVKDISNELSIEPSFVYQGQELGTAHAVKVAINRVFDDAIVIYGDLYIDVENVYNVLRNVINKNHRNIVTGVHLDDVSRYGKLITDGNRVIGIEEKPLFGGSGLVNAGIYLFTSKTLELVNEVSLSPRGEYELTDIINLGYKKGIEFRYITIDSRSWSDIGYPWDLLKASKIELEKISHRDIRGSIDPIVTIKGPVIIDDGAIVKGATYIEGPVYIGRNVSIGPNSYLRPYTVVLDGAHIGFCVEVKESIVMENTHAAHLSYIGDSIIAENVNLGAGTKIANLRLDEKTVKVTIDGKKIDSGRIKLGAIIGGYVKTGINVSIMPGVKIGSHSIIYPGITVYRDVPPKTVVKTNWI